MEVKIWKMISLSCPFLFTLSPHLQNIYICLHFEDYWSRGALKGWGLCLWPMVGTSTIEAEELCVCVCVFFFTSCGFSVHLLLLPFPSSLIFLPHSVQSSFYLKNGTKLGQYLSVCHSTELLLPRSRLSFWTFVARQKYREIVS